MATQGDDGTHDAVTSLHGNRWNKGAPLTVHTEKRKEKPIISLYRTFVKGSASYLSAINWIQSIRTSQVFTLGEKFLEVTMEKFMHGS